MAVVRRMLFRPSHAAPTLVDRPLSLGPHGWGSLFALFCRFAELYYHAVHLSSSQRSLSVDNNRGAQHQDRSASVGSMVDQLLCLAFLSINRLVGLLWAVKFTWAVCTRVHLFRRSSPARQTRTGALSPAHPSVRSTSISSAPIRNVLYAPFGRLDSTARRKYSKRRPTDEMDMHSSGIS